jgi:hypothetical protein
MVGDVPKALAELEAAISSSERFGLAPLRRFSRGQLPGYYFRLDAGTRRSSWQTR